MGKGALFVENPSDGSNRVNSDDLSEHQLPWCDPSLMPFDVSGPILKDLFLSDPLSQAFTIRNNGRQRRSGKMEFLGQSI